MIYNLLLYRESPLNSIYDNFESYFRLKNEVFLNRGILALTQAFLS